jgi:hypothetical protein
VADEKGAPADFAGPVLPNPKNLRPTLDTEIKRPVDEPTSDAKMTFGDTGKIQASVQNSPADSDKANGITPHPLSAHFSKKGGPVRRLHSAPVDVSEH